MTMIQRLADANRTEVFRASAADFKAQAEAGGWSFWRGVLIGAASSFPIGYLAAWGFPN